MIITITRAEGPSNLCGKPETFETFERANSRLFSMSLHAPRGGGYDKCDFKIEDAATDFFYNGRYDLKHFTVEAPDLKGQVVSYLRFMGGAARPDHMNEDRYAALLSHLTPADRQQHLDAADWAEKQP